MRWLVLALAAFLALAGTARGRTSTDVVRVPKPAFPVALTQVTPSGALRLTTVSAEPRSPGASVFFRLHLFAPRTLAGEPYTNSFSQPGTTFVVYGTGVIAAFGPREAMKYAFDLRSFGFPPRSVVPKAYGPQEVVWAQQVGRLLIVQTNHLGYAKDSGGRNGYLTGIDIASGNVAWRSPSLVANAGNFLFVNGMIISGYGFTAEKDWLYLLDPRTGRVRDRVALPSMAERLTRSGERIVVRCYDAKVVVRLA
jgi:hypothetical protein